MNLADLAKYMDPTGRVAPVAELLAQKNEILMDMPWQPGNLPTGHQYSQRTALPTASLRDYNEGVLPSKSAVAQNTVGMSIIEAWSEIDEAEAKLNGNENAFRAQEDSAFTESLEQELARLAMYGDVSSDEKEFNGFATLHPNIDQNCISAGGASGSTNTSIFLADRGDDLFMIYPKGSLAGLQNIDHGRQIIQFSDGKRMSALVSQFIWNCGMVQRDPRRSVRIANIEVADVILLANEQSITSYGTNIIFRMSDALYRLPRTGARGKKCFYMNRTIHAALTKMALEKSAAVLAIQQGLNQFGHAFQWLTFMGVPIRCIDQIVNTEAQVT